MLAKRLALHQSTELKKTTTADQAALWFYTMANIDHTHREA